MIYLFDHSEKLITQLKRTQLLSAVQEEMLNGIVRLDFQIPITEIDLMKDIEFVAHKDVNEPDKFYYYRIVSSSNEETSMSYTAISTFFDEMKGYGYLREYKFTDVTAELVLDTILSGSRWRTGIVNIPIKQASIHFYDSTRLDAISKLIDTYAVELKYRVILNGNKIVDRLVDMYEKIGYDTHKRFFYGANALSVVKEVNQQDIFTAVIGRGKGEEKFDTDGQSTGGYGRRINFAGISWSKANGKPVNKPLGQEYVEIPELTALYGYSDGTPRYKIIVHDKIETAEELLSACYDDLVGGSRPLVQFKSTIQELGMVYLGDTIGIIRKDLDIYYKTRVFRIKRNLIDDSISEIELGDNLEYNQAHKNKELINNIKDLGERVQEIANNANLAFVSVFNTLKAEFNSGFWNEDGYNYELKAGNEYGLPAGYYSFDAPIDGNPTKVVYMGAGKVMIANRKNPNGIWDFTTAIDGDGVNAEVITGILGEFAQVNANRVVIDANFSNTALGQEIANNANRVTIDANGIIVDSQSQYSANLNNINNAVIQNTLYNGVRINTSSGLTVSRSDGLVTVTVNATDGLRIDNRLNTSSAWKRAFYINTSGQAQFTGDLTILNSLGNVSGSIYASSVSDMAVQATSRLGLVDGTGNAYLRFYRGQYVNGSMLEALFNTNGVGFKITGASYPNDYFCIAPRSNLEGIAGNGMFVGLLRADGAVAGRGVGFQFDIDGAQYIDRYGTNYKMDNLITDIKITKTQVSNNAYNLTYVLDQLQSQGIYINRSGLR